MKGMTVLGAASFFILCTPVFAQDCQAWSQPTELSGVLVGGIYPGPPEYESVTVGDAPYSALMLHLTDPICITAGDSDLEPAVQSTELVQLACSEHALAALQSGERIFVSGTLFSAHTGHHVTPALLECQ